MLHLGAGRPTEAARWFRFARAADPSSREATAGLATLAWARGDLDPAIAGFERLVAAYPAPAHVGTLADLYRAAGDPPAARAVEATVRAQARLLLAAGAPPGVEVALFDADHGRPGAALAAARAEWARRRSVHVADALAWALHANGRDREAVRYADLALRLGTRDASFLFHAGMIRLALGDRALALDLLRRARATNPWFSVRWSPVLDRVLERLDGSGATGP
jgi:tetratricopeptide (TPR) repeat protein